MSPGSGRCCRWPSRSDPVRAGRDRCAPMDAACTTAPRRTMAGTAGPTLGVTLPTSTSILLTRGFAAPSRALYRAATEPDLLRRWCSGGPDVVAVADVDLRVGGRWR